MVIEHIPIDIESFTSDVVASLQGDTEPKTLKNLMEVNNLSELKSAMVFVTVVSVFFDGINTDSPEDHSILHNAVVRIFEENPKCRDIVSQGHYITAVFDTPFKSDIDNALDSVGKINAIFNIVYNVRKSTRIFGIRKGIGMAYGNVLLTTSGTGQQTICNWSGSTYETATGYAKEAAENANSRVLATYTIYNNLKEDYQKLFREAGKDKYEAYPVNIAMEKWSKSNV